MLSWKTFSPLVLWKQKEVSSKLSPKISFILGTKNEMKVTQMKADFKPNDLTLDFKHIKID